MKIYAYKQGSKSAKALADALGVKRIKHEGKPIHVDYLINWGSSRIVRDIRAAYTFNNPENVAAAANKLSAFLNMEIDRVSIPEFTTNQHVAEQWLKAGYSVVIRHVLNGHSGEGLEIITNTNLKFEIPEAPLYTKYIKKAQEYRVHVFHDNAFFIQRKARKKEVPDEQVNWQVRNLAGGFIFANQDVELPNEALKEAISAVRALGLDFGAVDLILGSDGKYYVLEVNCAPGLEGTSLIKYVAEFNKFR